MTTYTSLVRAVLLRPGMCTTNGSYAEVQAFLVGFVSGAAKMSIYSPIVSEAHAFEQWLGKQVNSPPAESLKTIGNLGSDRALKKLSELLDIYEAQVLFTED